MKLPETLIRLARKGLIEEAMTCFEKEKPMSFINNHLKVEKSLRDLRMKAFELCLKEKKRYFFKVIQVQVNWKLFYGK